MTRPIAVLLALAAAAGALAAAQPAPPNATEPQAPVAADPPPSPSAPQAPYTLVWKSVKVPGYGAFRLHIPPDWEVTAFGDPAREPVDVRLWPLHGKELDTEIHLSIQAPRVGTRIPSLATLRRDVQAVRDAFPPSAGTPAPAVQEMEGKALTAFYFSMQDESPAPTGGWRYMTYGSGLLGDFLLIITRYSNKDFAHRLVPTLVMMRDIEWERPTPEEAAATVAAAEAAIKRWEPVERSKAAGTIALTIGLPDKDWEVWVDLHDYRVERKKVEPDKSSAVLVASHPGTKVGFSALVKRVQDKDTRNSGLCANELGDQTKVPYARSGGKREVRDGMEVIQYDIGTFEGVAINQRNADAYLYRDGTCIDVHISKNNFRPGDQALFDLVLDNIKIVAK
jgi:hypothetical protein